MLGTSYMKPVEGQPNLAKSERGQAYFACTGPDGRQCRHCKFWYTVAKSGRLLVKEDVKRPCHKYKEISREPADRQEEAALLDIYREALGMQPSLFSEAAE